jgi:hypothetical protein
LCSSSVSGKSTNDETTSRARSLSIPWTVDGQVLHKIAYMELLMDEFQSIPHKKIVTFQETTTSAFVWRNNS